jgi:predicted nucleic acid-binding protein
MTSRYKKFSIIDASFIASWLLKESTLSKVQLNLFTDALNGKHIFGAPHLLYFEVVNTLVQAKRRRRINSADQREALRALEEFPIVYRTLPLGSETLDLAETLGLSGYDAAYAALALHFNQPLLTLDRKLAEAIESAL